MSLFTLSGVVEAPGRPPANSNVSLQLLAAALRERFDTVEVSDRSVEAAGSSLVALTFRGRRTHPILPFERVRLELDNRSPHHLNFKLSFKIQVIGSVYLALGSGLLASIDSGFAKGLAIGSAFGAAFFVLNHYLSRHRAFKWLSREWANALS